MITNLKETREITLLEQEKTQPEANFTFRIICHNEVLKDSITTQIELMKDASGNSKLVVK